MSNMSNQLLFINGQYYQVIQQESNFINGVTNNYYNKNPINNNTNYNLIHNNNYNEKYFSINRNPENVNQYNINNIPQIKIENNFLNNISMNPQKISYNKKPCGIINYGNNCYLNSGLQILATCELFIQELGKYKGIKSCLFDFLKEAFYKLLNEEIYDPINFLIYFCKLNNENIKTQYCSQNFIRNLLKKLNDELITNGDIHLINEYQLYKPKNQFENEKYINFITLNNYFPESNAFKLFSGITKNHSYGDCKNCKEYNEEISFNYFIDQIIYLDHIPNKCKFSTILFENIGKLNNLIINCKRCRKEIEIKEETKFIKLPEILIFTLERYQGPTNDAEIIPDEIIYMSNYVDASINLKKLEYELFAINIRFGKTKDFGHEICQVKRNDKWFEINDQSVEPISYERTFVYNNNSYGLFYKRKLK